MLWNGAANSFFQIQKLSTNEPSLFHNQVIKRQINSEYFDKQKKMNWNCLISLSTTDDEMRINIRSHNHNKWYECLHHKNSKSIYWVWPDLCTHKRTLACPSGRTENRTLFCTPYPFPKPYILKIKKTKKQKNKTNIPLNQFYFDLVYKNNFLQISKNWYMYLMLELRGQ